MSGERVGGRAFYWSIDVPGLTEESVSQLASVIRSSGLGSDPIPVDPETFLTLHIDRDTAVALKMGLLQIQRNSIVDGLRELIDDWLDSIMEEDL